MSDVAVKRVLIVDDHPLLRRGLASLIRSEADLEVCGEAESCSEGLAAFDAARPDLVIVDLELKGSDGLDLVKELQLNHPRLPVLVLSMHDEAVYAERSLRAGAKGYLSKGQMDDTILPAIRCLLEGRTYMSDALARSLAGKYVDGQRPADRGGLDALSDRELQVFRMIGRGRSTRQIAELLVLSVKTIESHRENIKKKLGASTAAELVHRATRWTETGRID